MASISDYVLDAALSKLDLEANVIHICSAEPAAYGALNSLGNSTSLSIGAPADRADPSGGREVTVAAIADGEVTDTGTASHFAIVDTVNSRLLVTGSLSASQAVTSGNSFSLAEFTIGIPDPA